MSNPDINYPALMEKLAVRFWKEPTKKIGNKWRWGSKGGRVVDLAKGTWHDFTDDSGGGVLDLVMRECSASSHGDAKVWLKEQGYVEADDPKDGDKDKAAKDDGPQEVPADLPPAAGGNGKASNGVDHEPRGETTPRRLLASYQYTDSQGSLLYEVQRWEWLENGKRQRTFAQRQPDLTKPGQWIDNIKGLSPTIYMIEEVREAVFAGKTVFITEGEKCVEALRAVGKTATCNSGGSSNWKPEFAEHFPGADVIVCLDNDDPGRKFGEAVAKSLHGKAKRIRVLDLQKALGETLPEKYDIADWLQVPGNDENLPALIDKAPDWKGPGKVGDLGKLRYTLFRNIAAQQERRQFLVEGLIGAGGESSSFYGRPKTGKSVLAADLAFHVATGKPWFGRKVQQGAVLFVAAEKYQATERRLRALAKTHGLVDVPIAVVRGLADLRSDAIDAGTLIACAKRLSEETGFPVVLIVIDTYARVLAGGDEISSKDSGAVIAHGGLLQAETGAHLLWIHHTPVGDDRRMRGHGSFLASIDTAFCIDKSEGGTLFTALITADNDKAEGTELAFNLKSVTLSIDPVTAETDDAPIVVPTATATAGEGFTVADVARAQAACAGKVWRENDQATDWVGIPISKALGLDIGSGKTKDLNPQQLATKKRLKAWLNLLVKNGSFSRVTTKSERREDVPGIEVGDTSS